MEGAGSMGAISLNTLFRRGCVQCPDTQPSCPPSCPAGQVCSITTLTCDSCPSTSCVDSGAPAAAQTSTASSGDGGQSDGPNIGAIAGGVIGGVVAVAILAYLVWRFCVKNKRQAYEEDDGDDDGLARVGPVADSSPSSPYFDSPRGGGGEKEGRFTMQQRDVRASTHTVASSIASTVLTRASNVIQIAYIPGVTNRSTPSTPGLLVPPVPPIPIALSPSFAATGAASSPVSQNGGFNGASSPAGTNGGYEEEQHFFMPADLRDSTYSGVSDRTSYAPRSSVASTIYGKNAVLSPVTAQQTVMRGKAAVVSVRSAGSVGGGGGGAGNSAELSMPPVPRVDYDRYGGQQPPPSPAFSVGSTFLNSASAATQARPQVVKVGGAARSKSSQQSLSGSRTERNGGDDNGKDDSDGSETMRFGRDSNEITIIDDTPSVAALDGQQHEHQHQHQRQVQGPFSDPPATPSTSKSSSSSSSSTGSAGSSKQRPEKERQHQRNKSLSAVIEEATKKAHGDVRAGLGLKRDSTPFGDEHEFDD